MLFHKEEKPTLFQGREGTGPSTVWTTLLRFKAESWQLFGQSQPILPSEETCSTNTRPRGLVELRGGQAGLQAAPRHEDEAARLRSYTGTKTSPWDARYGHGGWCTPGRCPRRRFSPCSHLRRPTCTLSTSLKLTGNKIRLWEETGGLPASY